MEAYSINLLILIFVIYLAPCFIVGSIGKYRIGGFWPAFLVSVFFTPVFGILCVIAAPFNPKKLPK